MLTTLAKEKDCRAMFETELDYFKAHQEELVERHGGKVLVIRDRAVVAVADTALDAYISVQAKFEPGTYMIQPCEPGPAAYSVTIASSEVLAGLSAG